MNHRPPGKVKAIDSPANPIIKEIRGLALKKNRDSTGRFLVEGLKLVSDGIDCGWTPHTVMHGASAGAFQQGVLARARALGASILRVSDRVLTAVARRDNPQMVIGVFSKKWTERHLEKPGADSLWIGLDRVRDPGNLGTIVRTADAVGADGVMLIGEVTDPFALEAVRATMGSVFHVGLCHVSREEFLEWRVNWSGSVYGTHLAAQEDYREAGQSAGPVLLLMGNEQQGLPAELAAACDRLFRIPMLGKADSLNLAVATGIMAYEIRRRTIHLPEVRRSGT